MTPTRRVGRPRQCPDDVLRLVVEMRASGSTLWSIANHLNAEGRPTPCGKGLWHAIHVSRLLKTRSAVELMDALCQTPA